MKRLILASFAVALISWGSDASAAPKALTDAQLDRVVAGTVNENNHVEASGGAIIGADSEASFNTEGHVGVSGNAQKDASALNMVNAAESLVGNGVNIWLDAQQPDALGSIVADGLYGADAYVTQNNNIDQDARKVAHVDYWGHLDLKKSESLKTWDSLKTSAETSGHAIGASGIIELSLGGVPFAANLDGGLNFFAEGSICASGEGGTCKATLEDKSSFETSHELELTYSGLENATAEYITGDNVKLDVNSVNTVCLSGDAQKGASAVNIVNAASSLVANGVNIASTGLISAYSATDYATAYLTQNNYINQRR